MFGSDVAVNMWPHRVTKEVKALREDGFRSLLSYAYLQVD